MKLKKNGKCSNCRKTETVTIYDEPNPQLEICLPCRIENVRSTAKDVREALEKLKKENKETEYPEFKSQLEEVKQEALKMIPEEERSEVGGEKPTN
ncbi:1478_t:CDS:2 [Funneliformis geosporum]|uniref:1478_t:CDS:1 n=1 Tax=Funneliformis geosporum TaxID=1117311 RepID=A0A9W4SI52_9GLOM|nr:1478_t:CDS:2 [Funneliformis geosporum]